MNNERKGNFKNESFHILRVGTQSQKNGIQRTMLCLVYISRWWSKRNAKIRVSVDSSLFSAIERSLLYISLLLMPYFSLSIEQNYIHNHLPPLLAACNKFPVRSKT